MPKVRRKSPATIVRKINTPEGLGDFNGRKIDAENKR